jgi:hypothetical protein
LVQSITKRDLSRQGFAQRQLHLLLRRGFLGWGCGYRDWLQVDLLFTHSSQDHLLPAEQGFGADQVECLVVEIKPDHMVVGLYRDLFAKRLQ